MTDIINRKLGEEGGEKEERVLQSDFGMMSDMQRIENQLKSAIAEKKRVEEALRRKEMQLKDSQRVARIGSWEWDVDENKVTWSDELYCLFGMNPNELEASYEAFLQMVHPDDIGKLDGAIRASISDRTQYHVDARIIRKDGSQWVMEARGEAAYGESGRAVLIKGTAQDVTERKWTEQELLKHHKELSVLVKSRTSELRSVIDLLRDEVMERRTTEEALLESEKRYRGLFDYMSSGVAVFDALKDGRDFIFKDFNQAGERIDKIRKKDIIGKRVTEVFPGVRQSGLFEVFQQVWNTGEPRHYPVSHYENDRITSHRKNYIYKLPSGEIVVVYDDVTEQMRMAAREAKLLRELKTIFENFPVGIIYLDDKYRIISANKFFNDFTGFNEDELVGKICYEVIGEFAGPSSKKGRRKICSFCKKEICFSTKKPAVLERELGEKFVRVTTIPELDENGNISRFMEIVEDITERKLAEAEAVRASHLAALGELAAGVAHEINNPINGIINYTQILANKSRKGSEEHDITGRIIKEGDRIAGIVKNLLSFACDRKEDKVPVNIQDVLSDSLALTETQLRKDGVRLMLNIPLDLPSITAQMQQLEQVFLNVISNARYALNRKYPGAHEGKILEIKGKEITINKRPYIRIIFYDRGTGIPRKIINKIMNPFFSTKSGDQGTGLGLSISLGIINDHGGKLSIESAEGEYTRVIIELPARRNSRTRKSLK